MTFTLSNYAANRYFPYSFFGGVWPGDAGIILYPAGATPVDINAELLPGDAIRGRLLPGDILEIQTATESGFDVVLDKIDEITANLTPGQNLDVELLSSNGVFARSTKETGIKGDLVKPTEIGASKVVTSGPVKTIKIVSLDGSKNWKVDLE